MNTTSRRAGHRPVLPVIVALLGLASGGAALAEERDRARDDAHYAAEAASIAELPGVRRAFETVERLEPGNLATLVELTEIPAPPFYEEARGLRFAELIRAAGIDDVEIDEVGNVLARRPGTEGGHTTAVVAHLDTVFPPGTALAVEVRDGRYYAPGIGDNVRGLVTLLLMIEALGAADISTRGDVLFVGSVGEEGLGDLRGVKYLFREGGPRIDAFVAVDGGSDERVLNRAIGSHRYRVSFSGPGGHSWGAFGLANPAHALSSAIHYFELEAGDLVSSGPRTTFNIGRTGGGTSVNAVPFESWAEVDLRSEDPAQLQRIDALLRRAVDRALNEHNERRAHGDPLTAELEAIGIRPSGTVAPDSPLVSRALAATRFFGIEPVLGSGSTDANVPIARGVPATTVSRGGRSEGAHSLGEWWSPENADIGVKKLILLVLATAGVAP